MTSHEPHAPSRKASVSPSNVRRALMVRAVATVAVSGALAAGALAGPQAESAAPGSASEYRVALVSNVQCGAYQGLCEGTKLVQDVGKAVKKETVNCAVGATIGGGVGAAVGEINTARKKGWKKAAKTFGKVAAERVAKRVGKAGPIGAGFDCAMNVADGHGLNTSIG